MFIGLCGSNAVETAGLVMVEIGYLDCPGAESDKAIDPPISGG